MMIKFMNRTVVGFAFGLTLGAVANVANAQSVGVAETTIRVGTSGILSGPSAGQGAVAYGMALKFDAINAEGGVRMGDGVTRTIELVITDDAGEPPRALANVRTMVEQDGIFAVVGQNGTQMNQAIRPYIERRSVPSLFAYTGAYEFGDASRNPMSVPLVPSFTTEAAIYAEYLRRHKPNAKVGILYMNNDFGQNFVAGLEAAIEGSTIEILATQPANFTDPTVDTQLTVLRQAGVDTLLVATIPRPAAQAVRFASESGWKPLTIVSYAASSVVALEPAGLENLEGIVTAQFIKPVSSEAYANDEGVARYLEDHKRFSPRFQSGDTLGQVGYTIGEALVAVLEQMNEPTAEAALDAARHLRDLELSLLLPGIKLNTDGTDDPWPIETMQPFVFQGGRYVAVGEAINYEGRTPVLK